MQIHGFNKTTLLDYPGLVACTIFTGSCNFRCPFCQNSDLVLDPSSQPVIPEEEVLSHLERRKGITKGICVTGGEPTLQKDLPEFLKKIKEKNLLVKLDTNGYRPEVLKKVVEEGLVDYVAMDVKSSLSGYSKAAGSDVEVSLIKESIDFIKHSSIDYEFRTTVTRELHNKETFSEIANLLDGAKKYFLQGYKESERVLVPGMSAYSYEELEAFLPLFTGKIETVGIRGLDD